MSNTAKWVIRDNKEHSWYCSNCGYDAYWNPGDCWNYWPQQLFNYCPYCGAEIINSTAHWILGKKKDQYGGMLDKCSSCGHEVNWGRYEFFCFNCGSKMDNAIKYRSPYK